MKLRTTAVCALTAIAIMAQSLPASAHGRDHWGGGRGHGGVWPILGLAAVGTALVVGTAELLTAPIRAVGEAAAPDQGYGYNQAPAPQPQYYAQAPAYYPPPVYQPAPVAYYPAPAYYPPPAYYGRGYYR